MSDVLAYVAAGSIFFWGSSHLVPTREVVDGFGDITADNRLIIKMEWVAEGLAFWFAAALIVAVTASGDVTETAAELAYYVTAGFLLVVGVWTAMTAARTPVVWFKVCPVVMSLAAGLLIAAGLL